MGIQKRFIYGLAGGAVIIAALVFFVSRDQESASVSGTFRFVSDTQQSSILAESGSMKRSASPDWWVNSGALMRADAETFSTNIGPLPEDGKMRKLYKKNNPTDTDDGYYPQNIFRLVTRGQWQNLSQEVYFFIDAINLSESKNRAESNGVLLFNRYQDGDNLYYTGLRVDGHAVIKKKIAGKYYTLKEKRVLTGSGDYDRKDNPNLLPLRTWMGIRSEVTDTWDGAVDIKLYVDQGAGQGWQLVLETKDQSDDHGKAPFLNKGYAGIRTDFMDARFKGYSISEIGG